MNAIINGRPISYSCNWSTKLDNKLLTDFDQAKQDLILQWVRENFIPSEKVLRDWTSYGLKHILEKDLKLYLSNNQFKDAMLMCGFEPFKADELNWKFRISRKSLVFKKRE